MTAYSVYDGNKYKIAPAPRASVDEKEEKACGPPILGERVPNFEADTNQGKLVLFDIRDKWILLFSHPADFTPVCTSEFVEFAKLRDEFEKRKVQLIGLSIDSVQSHIAWVRGIAKKFGVEIYFPIIADRNMRIAKLYGMIHPDISEMLTVRSVFFIDPQKRLRATISYPKYIGRNIDEIMRVIDALQTVDRENVETPANWRPGEPVVLSEPVTQDEAQNRLADHGLECLEWYYCKKNVEPR